MKRPTKPKPFDLPVSSLALEPNGEPGHLLGDITIAGVQFHVEAVEVDPEDLSTAINSSVQGRIDAVKDFDEGHGIDYQTVEINGKPHFLVIHPYQQ